jgi:hypothetical protein
MNKFCVICDCEIEKGKEVVIDDKEFCSDIHADEYADEYFQFGQ